MRTALRTLEGLLLDGGRRTARRNAWQAVVEDRHRARARAEAELLLTAMPAVVPPTTSAALPAAGAQAGAHAVRRAT
jgi:hypothetical protein